MSAAPPLGPTRRERRKREVHDRILAAAVRLFDLKGFGETRVDEICERADVAQKTFFNHFATKQALLREIAEDSLERLLSLVEEARKAEATTAERLALLFRRVADATEAAGPMHRELVTELIHAAQASGAEPEQTRRLHGAFRGLIRDGIQAGDVSREHGVDALTDLAVGAFYSLYLNWVHLEDYPLRARAAAMGRMLTELIAA